MTDSQLAIIYNYLKGLVEAIQARDAKDFEQEENLLEELDYLWFEMEPHTIEVVNQLIQEELTIDELTNLLKKYKE